MSVRTEQNIALEKGMLQTGGGRSECECGKTHARTHAADDNDGNGKQRSKVRINAKNAISSVAATKVYSTLCRGACIFSM